MIRTKFRCNDSLLTMQVTMSYLEIYNENIRDLLDPSSGYLELRDESGGRNIQVTGGIRKNVSSNFRVIFQNSIFGEGILLSPLFSF